MLLFGLATFRVQEDQKPNVSWFPGNFSQTVVGFEGSPKIRQKPHMGLGDRTNLLLLCFDYIVKDAMSHYHRYTKARTQNLNEW